MKTQELVKQIHNEFMTAAELYVEEMEPKLVDYDQVKKVADRHKKLGFTNTNNTAEEWQMMVEKEMVDAYYKAKVDYPGCKFITEDLIKNVCGEYGLIWSDVSNYAGYIPEINLQRIEAFKEKYSTTIVVYERRDWLESKPWREYRPRLLDRLRFLRKDYLYHYPMDDWRRRKRTENYLSICAPKDQMMLTVNQRVVDHKIEEVPQQIPDPIVLHKTDGGYIIVTAWGPEASDPDVVNPLDN